MNRSIVALGVVVFVIAVVAVMFMLSGGDDESTAPTPDSTTPGACEFAATDPDTPVYSAPLSDPSQLLTAIQPGTVYAPTQQRGTHFLVAYSDTGSGWVDRRTGILNGDCDSLPQDTRPLTEYGTLCVLTTSETLPTYTEPALVRASDTSLISGTAYLVLRRSNINYGIMLDSGATVWVDANRAQITGACDGLPLVQSGNATVIVEAQVWSEPNAQTADVVANLPAGTQLRVAGNPLDGPVSADGVVAPWYPIQGADVAGWVVASVLTLD